METNAILTILGIFTSGMLIICLGLYKVANGRLSRKVSEDTCKANVSGIKALFTEHREHIDQRFDDLKDTIKNGGK